MRAVASALVLLCVAPCGRTAAQGIETTVPGVEKTVPADQTATTETAALRKQPTLVFSFVPRAADQPKWEIRVRPDRSGSFRELSSGTAEQPLRVSEAAWRRLVGGERAVRSDHCETKAKGIAQTGVKTFSLGEDAAPTSCTFNYSDDEALNDAGAEFQAIAAMMQMGAKLQHDLRFDRLALDADMDGLLAEVAGGRAAEPQNIAAVLQAMVDNDRVIDRVRRKAARLLQGAGAMAPAAGADKLR